MKDFKAETEKKNVKKIIFLEIVINIYLLFHYYVIFPFFLRARERAKYESVLHCSKRIAL